MKIYLVTCGYDYEGSEVKACLATREEADALKQRIESDRENYHYDDVTVEEWTVGQVTA